MYEACKNVFAFYIELCPLHLHIGDGMKLESMKPWELYHSSLCPSLGIIAKRGTEFILIAALIAFSCIIFLVTI